MSLRSASSPWRSIGRWVGFAVRLAALASLAAVVGGFVLFVERLDGGEPRLPPRADGIVVLTGGADRVQEALELLQDGSGGRLLISGVNPSTSAEDLIRAVPDARRLLDCCIELGYAAGNTVGNARETRDWVRRHGLRSLIVVTSDYHMPRALAEIGDAAQGVALLPFPVVSERAASAGWWRDGGRLRRLLAEYVKYAVVLARIRLHPAAPDDRMPSLEGAHLSQGG